VPLPKAAPPRPTDDKPLAERPQPPQQSAAIQAKPADTAAAPPAVESRPTEVKPVVPEILPTKPMPEVQGLD
jgi:hypothetical protein